jgi:hypothetical protein
MYIAFEVSSKAQITVRKHASREQTAMNLLKRLWQWYSDRRTERRMLKGDGQGNRILSCSGEHRQQVVFVKTT